MAPAVLAGAAAWLATGAGPASRRLPVTRRPTFLRARGLGRRAWAIVAIAAAGVLLALTGPIPASVMAIAGYALTRRVNAGRSRRLAREARVQDLAALRALSAELASGLPPAAAFRMVGGDPASAAGLRRRLLAAAGADSLGGDPADVLRAGSTPGSPAAALAAAWSICRRSGTSLAAPAHRIAESAAAELRVEREAETALASARSSSHLLAALPMAGVLLGQLSGSESLRVLFTTGPGQLCLMCGAALDLAGLAWLDRLAAGAGV
jgi:tight adherence protein B